MLALRGQGSASVVAVPRTPARTRSGTWAFIVAGKVVSLDLLASGNLQQFYQPTVFVKNNLYCTDFLWMVGIFFISDFRVESRFLLKKPVCSEQ